MVKLPKSTPLSRDAIDGRNSIGSIFLKLYLEMESINKKLIIEPINNCGCFITNGIMNATKLINII